MKTIKKIFTGLLVMLICFTLTGCMDKKVKSITVKMDNATKIMGLEEGSIEAKAMDKALKKCEWVFHYSKDNQKLKSSSMTIVIDLKVLKKQVMEEFKKSKEYKELKKEDAATTALVMEKVKETFDNELSYETFKREFGSNGKVTKEAGDKIKVVKDFNDVKYAPKAVKKIDDVDKTTKKIEKAIRKKFGLNKKDYKIVVKNY